MPSLFEQLNKSYEEGIGKLEEDRVKISCKLKETISTMEKCTSKTIEDNQIERNQIKEKLNAALRSYKSGQENYEKLAKQLDMQSLSFDQQTAGQKLMKSANDQLLSKYEQEAVNSYQEEQLANLLNEREELKGKLSSLEQTVEAYVQKEAAYKETLIKVRFSR